MPRSRRSRRPIAALLVAAGPAAAAGDRDFAGGGFEADVRTAVTRSASFALPAGDLGDPAELAAVRLFRSADGGVSWAPAGTFPPTAARLPHAVARDGSYLFSVRGLDRQGNMHPPYPPAGQFRVVVDTAGPRLTLKGWWTGEDRVRLTVRCADPHLEPDSVRLRWLAADPAAQWEDVTPEPGEATAAAGRGDGGEDVVTVDLSRDPGTPFDLLVRASAEDAAGNRSEAVLELPRPAAAVGTTAGEVAVLHFGPAAAPARFPAPARPRPLPAAANPVARVARAAADSPGGLAEPPPGGGFPVARFPVATFPAAEISAPAFPVARFAVPVDEQVPAAPADPLNTGWGEPAGPFEPAESREPAGSREPAVLFDVDVPPQVPGAAPAG